MFLFYHRRLFFFNCPFLTDLCTGRGVSSARAAVREACRSAENAIAEMLLSGGVHCGDTAVLSFENGEYRLKITEKAIDNGVAV